MDEPGPAAWRERLLVGLLVLATLVLGAVQLAVALPVLAVHRLRRALHRPEPLPGWARDKEPDARLVLRLAASLDGLAPGTLGSIAVAQARAGDGDAGRATLARAEARLDRLARIPGALRWDDGLDPGFERRRLDECHRRFAAVALDRGEPAPPPPGPAALRWFGAPAPDDPLGPLLAAGRFDEALALARRRPRDATSAQPAAALAAVALALHAAQDPRAAATLREAVEVARRFSNVWPIGDDSGYRENALRHLVVLQAAIGDAGAAGRTLILIHDQESADLAAADVALLLARRDERREALSWLWTIADREIRARACLDLAALPPE